MLTTALVNASAAATRTKRPDLLSCACVNMPLTVGPTPNGPDTRGKRRANGYLVRPRGLTQKAVWWG